MTELEFELREALNDDIDGGRIVIDDDLREIVAKIRTLFPFHVTGIAWDRVPKAAYLPAGDKKELRERLPSIETFFLSYCHAAQTSPETTLIVFGDGVTDSAYRMNKETFLRHMREFLELPQSTVVITSDFKWLFQYRFFEDAFFAPAESPREVNN